MANRYGHFSADGSEYIITTPDLPRPWINYLTNGDYCALCSHVGGGFSFHQDHRLHGVLRRGEKQHIADLPGRIVYIKDEDSGELWTVNVHPSGKHTTYEARHGLGYTTIDSSYAGIHGQLRFFVPPGVDAELWTLQLTNRGTGPRRLAVYATAEFTLGNVSLEECAPVFMGLFNEVTMGSQEMHYRKRWWHADYGWSEVEGEWPLRVFAATTVPPVKMSANRDQFFGPGREVHHPQGVDTEVLPDAVNDGKDPAAILQWRINLPPGQSWSTHLAIGVYRADGDATAMRKQVAALQRPATYADLWQATRDAYRHFCQQLWVGTPDDEINTMANWWNKHQLLVNFHFGRGPSYYHKGQYPAMRDSCQDAFGVIPLDPPLAKRNLIRIAHFFFADGRACGGCNRLGLKEGPSIKVDLPLWFGLATADYLRETGDFAFLDLELPLMDGGSSTVYAKLLAGVDRMLDQRGPHGLPLIGKGDWNDAANNIGSQGKGESVWLAQFLCFVIQELAPLLTRRGDHARLARYQARAAEVKRLINEQCWDGEWFVRAFRDDGRPVGVKGEKEGFIWINSQTWAVIAGISDPKRLGTCMDAVEKHMGTPYGLTNLAPAYTEVDESIGLITRFRAGWKENGAVFSHASAFNVVARALLGRGTAAVDLYQRILPLRRDPDQYLMEPYAFSQFCAGPITGPEFGQGSYHWLTGTAAWMLRALTDYIIGVRADYDGIRLAPAVPPTWRDFTMRRTFRGARYDFVFHNPDGVETGVKEVRLDGQVIAGTQLPLPTAAHHRVEVTMGK